MQILWNVIDVGSKTKALAMDLAGTGKTYKDLHDPIDTQCRLM